SFMYGLTLLQEAVGKEQRPLSWVIGPQGVYRADSQSTKDKKRSQRRQTTVLGSPMESTQPDHQ
ncbi:MAG: hypothetical protein ACE5KM_02675, partial [Planctomycetaceae bacterium]